MKSHSPGIGVSQSEKPAGSDKEPHVLVEESLAKATEAAEEAETAVEFVDSLPSAWPDPLVSAESIRVKCTI